VPEEERPPTSTEPRLEEVDTDAEAGSPARSKLWIVVVLVVLGFFLLLILEHAGPLHGIIRGIHGGGGH
jgi:hypothetical protein